MATKPNPIFQQKLDLLENVIEETSTLSSLRKAPFLLRAAMQYTRLLIFDYYMLLMDDFKLKGSAVK